MARAPTSSPGPARPGHGYKETITPILVEDAWYQKWWRPTCAFAYLGICLLDFAIMPIIFEAARSPAQEIVTLALQFDDPAAQIQALSTLRAERAWSPLTLIGNGMFHLAFGAIIAGAAITRGYEKRERVRSIGGGGFFGSPGGLYVESHETEFEATKPKPAARRKPRAPKE